MITIEQDFENEIALAKPWSTEYPFINFIIKNEDFKNLLFEQFKEIKPTIKATLYAYDIISQDEFDKALADKENKIAESIEELHTDELEHLRKNLPEDYKKYKSKKKEFAEFDESKLLKKTY